MKSTSTSSEKRSAPPQLIFDDGSRVMVEAAHAETDTPHHAIPSSIRGDTLINEYYEIDRVTDEILKQLGSNETEIVRVAVQFPDELLDDSPEVMWQMEETLTNKLPASMIPFVFCLGDTTVGSCCPDEVAALHLQADVMVHYGHACLSPTGTLPVIYSFGSLQINVDETVKRIMQDFGIPEKLLVLYQVGYHHAMDTFGALMEEAGVKEVVIGQIPRPTRKKGRPAQISTSCCGGEADSPDGSCQRNFPNENFRSIEGDIVRNPLVIGGLELPDSYTTWEQIAGYTIIYIGEYSTTSKRQYVNVMLQLLSLSTSPSVYWMYSPKAKSLSDSVPINLQKALNRRFFLTQKARDASVFGILVSNLSQQHLVEVVKALKLRIQNEDKTSYSFAVGKINQAKLANFAEIECFVLVACREHSLLDEEREYPVPVITPLELDVALGNLEWGTESYSLDCQDILKTVDGDLSSSPKSQAGGDDDAPYFSLVTGKFTKKATTTTEQPVDLEHLPGRGQVTSYNSEASKFLKKREYQGLDTLAGQTEVKAAIEGQRGIASDYAGL